MKGDSKNRLSRGCKGTFLVIPITTPLSQAGAPQTAPGGLSSVLIGDLLDLEPGSHHSNENAKSLKRIKKVLKGLEVDFGADCVLSKCKELEAGTGRYKWVQRIQRFFSSDHVLSKCTFNHQQAGSCPKCSQRFQRIRVLSGRDCVFSEYTEFQGVP